MQPASSAATANRSDRDKFVAFAFCTADLLIELDSRFQVVYAAGASQAILGRDAGKLVGEDFLQLVAASQRTYMGELLEQAVAGKRFEWAQIALSDTQGTEHKAAISGYTSRRLNNHVFIALRPGAAPTAARTRAPVARPAAPGEKRSVDFTTSLQSRLDGILKRPAAQGAAPQPTRMTVFEMKGVDQVRSRLEGNEWAALQGHLRETVRDAAVDGETAGQLGDGKLALIHGGDTPLEALERQIGEMVRAADPAGIGITLSRATVDLDPSSLSSEEAVRALVYTVRQLADDTPARSLTLETLKESLGPQVKATAQRISQVKAAMAGHGWRTAQQPVVDLATRTVHHTEALLRFDPALLKEEPGAFVRFAEETGLITEFDLRMCGDMVMRQRDLRRAGNTPRPVAVNLSGRSLESPGFISQLRSLLARVPDVKGLLFFELTDSARIRDLTAVNAAVQELRADGFPVCLDDFGAGESTFEIMRTLDVDYVKIDGSCINNAHNDVKSRAFLAAMAGLCAALGTITIAKQVETEAAIPLLQRIGVRLAQGYLFGKPEFS